MNARTFIALSTVAACVSFGQGTFQNLDFESATIVPIVFGGRTYIQFGPAFPGWTGYFDSSPVSPMFITTYYDINIGTVNLGLVDQNTQFGNPISHYTALLQSSLINGSPAMSMAQTGVVPGGTLSLRFDAITFGPNFVVSMNGQPLSVGVLQDFGTYKAYGADIATFAGQSAELRFTKPHGSGDLYFDNISFSPLGVPEPGTWALLTLGGALLWCGMRRRRK